MNNKIEKLHIDDTPYETELPEGFFKNLFDSKRNLNEIRAIIPGTIADIKVQEGEKIKPGQVILTLEAMKMFNDIEAAAEGRIAEINIKVGDRVEKNQLMIRIES